MQISSSQPTNKAISGFLIADTTVIGRPGDPDAGGDLAGDEERSKDSDMKH